MEPRQSSAGIVRRVLASTCALAALAGAALAASTQVLVEDRRGRAVAGLGPADFELRLGGEPVPVASVAAARGSFHVTIVFDRLASTAALLETAAAALAERAALLTELGAVEVFVAGERAIPLAEPTRDAAALAGVLEELTFAAAIPAQVAIRREFVESERLAEFLEEPGAAVSATAGRRLAELARGLAAAAAAENELLEGRRDTLLRLLASGPPAGPRLVVWVTGGQDSGPEPYYRRLLEVARLEDVGVGLASPTRAPDGGELGRTIAALDRVLVVFAPEPGRDDELPSGAQHGADRVETVLEGGRVVDRTTVGIDPRRWAKKLLPGARAEAAELLAGRLLEPLAEPASWAAATGGELVRDAAGLEVALGARREALLVAHGDPPPAAGYVRLELSVARPGARVRARQWASAATPEPVAALRARDLLRQEVAAGGLEIGARLVAAAAAPALELELPPRLAGPLRVTVAGGDPAAAAVEHRRLAPGARHLALDGWSAAVEPLAVVVEELASGRWGGTLAEAARASLPAAARALEPPGATPVRLLEPDETVLMGEVLFSALAAAAVAEVRFFVDGALVASSSGPPFAARVDFGRLPEPRSVEAVAYDAAGVELGRDRLRLNQGGGRFAVRIVAPRPSRGGDSAPVRGPVEVVAEVSAGGGDEVERVEFYWMETLVGTRFAPPYVQQVVVPATAPRGFVRVVAHLVGGASAEDVLFVNSPAGERLRVDLVEIYTVVTDRKGRPIRGLEASDFRIFEDGIEQKIASFGDAGAQALTVGLAIDSSASMFVKLPEVQAAAASFVAGLERGRDRVFVVRFGNRPTLAQETTSDLASAENTLWNLEPEGQTSIWKAIVHSLVELQGVPGKKAVIVYSDGADEDPDFSHRTATEFARRLGIPVYVILSNDELYRTGGRGLTVRGFLGRLETLTEAVGGRVFLTRVGEDLGAVYRRIDRELRSQYLIGFYPERGEGAWRRVRVEVLRPGARARTVSGYYR